MGIFLLVALVVIVGLVAVNKLPSRADRSAVSHASSSTAAASTSSPKKSSAVASSSSTTACAGNTLDQLIIVSISKQHLWACNGASSVYDSPVVTGQENLAADLTPTGTYHIYAKQTDLYLNGQDSTGAWHDYVYYWEPFLSNQYGQYGFHDATWRPSSAFGNINPYSSDGSHGCVEMPLAAAKWLYDWSYVGTTVTIVG